MASKKPPPSDMEPEDTIEYVNNEDNDDDEEEEDHDYNNNDEEEDDDDEDDFIPGMDDEDDDDDDEGAIVPLLDGILSIDQDKILHYRGEGFHLASTKSVDCNLLDCREKLVHPFYTVVMEGPCDIESVGGNPTNRKLEMTWSIQDARQVLLTPSSQSKIPKSDDDNDDVDDDEEEEGKKAPALYYAVHGKQIECLKGESLELQGGYSPPIQGKEVSLVCQVRIIPIHLQVASVAAAAAPVAAARINEDEDEDEADGGVDYEELIALHEDAGLSVEELKKKYRNREGDSQTAPSKRTKTTDEKDLRRQDDDDDDEDYCF